VQLVIFYLYLMLHACAARFDVMSNFFKKICKIFGSKQSLNGINRASIVHLEGAVESRCETKESRVFLSRPCLVLKSF